MYMKGIYEKCDSICSGFRCDGGGGLWFEKRLCSLHYNIIIEKYIVTSSSFGLTRTEL
jgi:hypothetical protein